MTEQREHRDQEAEERRERRHTRAEYDRHEDDLEHLDAEDVVADAIEFFDTEGERKPSGPTGRPYSP